ncbi:MAG: DUF2357 domain-containing protein [Bacilli bacterium]|nr:DUF2357 domain-containing protein [Bacilli bacterium]
MNNNLFDKEYTEEARTQTKKFLKKLESEMAYQSKYNGDLLSFEWLDEIEEACPRIDKIVRVAKVALIQEANVELIEKAKRITVESVKDLSRHTNYINKYDEKTDTVEPGKILDIRNEETFNIYENRFLHTLVNTMERFILEREDELKELDISDEKLLEYRGKTQTGSERLNIEIKVTSETLATGEVNKELKEKIEEVKKRIKRIKEYIGSWHKSEMMKALDKAHIPPVRSPLKKTNVFLKNPNFRVASALWEYLNRYGFEDNNKEKDNIVSDGNDVIKGFLDHSFLINYYVLESTSNSKREQKRQLSKYAVVMLKEEIKRIVDLLLSCGLKITEEDLMKLLAEELKHDKSDRLVGADDVKKKFKNAMDEYLERTQEYL